MDGYNAQTQGNTVGTTWKTAIAADSSCGIPQEEAKQLGVTIIPVPFYINGEMFFEGITMSVEEFYTHLGPGVQITTSQPNIAEVKEVWDTLLQEYDEIVWIPQTKGISATYENTCALAQEYNGRVQTVNNYRVCGSMRQAVEDAVFLRAHGKNAVQIREILEEQALTFSAYMAVDTMEYLKRGGRVTPAVAAIATILSIKPILYLGTGLLEVHSKVRGKNTAKKEMIRTITEERATRFAEQVKKGQMRMLACYTGDPAEGEQWKKEIEAAFPGEPVQLDPFPLNIAAHVGPGALAILCVKRITEEDL